MTLKKAGVVICSISEHMHTENGTFPCKCMSCGFSLWMHHCNTTQCIQKLAIDLLHSCLQLLQLPLAETTVSRKLLSHVVSWNLRPVLWEICINC